MTASRGIDTVRRRALAALGTLAMAAPQTRFGIAQDATPPVVGTPMRVIERMFWISRLRSSDTLIDLGSGEGAVVLEAAQRFGARAIGVEMRPDLVEASRRKAQGLGVADRALFRAADIFSTDLAEASVLTLYLSSEFNERLIPRILEMMRPGSRVVSHDFALGAWQPDALERLDVPEKNHGRGGESLVMLWIVPARVGGRWQATVGEGSMRREFEFSIVQQYQVVEGALRTGRSHRRFPRALLRADQLTMDVVDAPSPYGKGGITARVDGERMTGVFRFDGTSAIGAPFSAVRTSMRPEIFE